MPRSARLSGPTTACICIVSNPRFENSATQEDPAFITMDVDAKFNGLAELGGYQVVFGVNATSLQKQAAVRAVVNQILQGTEPSATLGNAAIQIIGLPV